MRPNGAAFYAPKEIATLLNISLFTVYRLVDQKNGPPVKRIGRIIRFPKAAFDQWAGLTK